MAEARRPIARVVDRGLHGETSRRLTARLTAALRDRVALATWDPIRGRVALCVQRVVQEEIRHG